MDANDCLCKEQMIVLGKEVDCNFIREGKATTSNRAHATISGICWFDDLKF